jgi:hypothetical protein
MPESDLYAPIKAHLQSLGFKVRAEVGSCDIVAVQNTTLIAVELKQTFGLPVIYQALERLKAADLVYIATAVPEGRRARGNFDAALPQAIRLCRLIGLGLLSVRNGIVAVHADPGPYQPRKQAKHRARLLSEFTRRSGDHNIGGTTRRPRMTAYREDALACAAELAANGAMTGAAVKAATGIPSASTLMHRNVYGWFNKVARGTYAITDSGQDALRFYADVLAARHTATAASSAQAD